jgi:hypothetical protein
LRRRQLDDVHQDEGQDHCQSIDAANGQSEQGAAEHEVSVGQKNAVVLQYCEWVSIMLVGRCIGFRAGDADSRECQQSISCHACEDGVPAEATENEATKRG